MPPLYLYARVHFLLCANARETSGAASTRSSLRPLIGEGKRRCKTSGDMRCEIAKLYPPVIASAARIVNEAKGVNRAYIRFY
jgi:hypothetical protein